MEKKIKCNYYESSYNNNAIIDKNNDRVSHITLVEINEINDISTLNSVFLEKNIDFIQLLYNLGYLDEDFVDVIDVIEVIMDIEKKYDLIITDDLSEIFIDKTLSEIKLKFIPYIREKKLNDLGI